MHDSLNIVLILLAAAVGAVALFRRMNLPPMLGYLLVGILIGPHALGFVPESGGTRYLAEFGVVFLMFSVGLEFSLPQLVSMRHIVFGFGSAQVISTLLLTLAAALALGLDWQAGVALGGVIAMSSTAIVSKMLAEKLELHSLHGRQIMGVLLFQDLAVVPLLILVPALAAGSGHMAYTVGLALFKAVVVLAVLLFLGQHLMRRWFHLVALQKSSELFVLNVLLVTLGLAFLTELAGLSLALGAFLAGMLLSETEYRYQVEDYIKPFRDVLLGLFFVTIGMLLDLKAVAANLPWVLLALAALLTGKLALILGIAKLFRLETPVALRCALALSPAGEFGFVLLAQAGGLKLMPEAVMQVVLAAMLLSMLAAPFILANSDRIVLRFCESEWILRAMALHELSVKSMAAQEHVIVCGYGRSGQAVARFLEREEIPVIALDYDPQRVRQAAAAGESVVYGDAGRREVLVAAGVARAAAVVVSFSDAQTALKILSHVQELRPGLPVIVRTLDDSDLEALKDAGAAEIVPEVLEGSLMLATQTMMLLGVPLARVLRRLREVRSARYQLMRGFFHGVTDAEGDLEDTRQPRLYSVVLQGGAASLGKTIGELGLEGLGVEVTAVRRRNIRGLNPGPETRLQENDVVVLLGTPENLARAEMRLLQG